MNRPQTVPELVAEALSRFARQHPDSAVAKALAANPESLSWDSIMGCYFFTDAGMYRGVERNGYIHT